MKRTVGFALMLAAALSLGTSPRAAAQKAGVGIRVGTLGLGAEVALALNERIAVRGGIGVNPIDPEISLSEIDVTADFPTWYNVGLDLYLNGALHLGAGMLLKPNDPTLRAVFTQDQEVGGQTFTPDEIGTLVGVIDSRTQAPYFLIGFGNHTAPGTGLYLDVGIALMGEPRFQLDAIGGTLDSSSGQFRAALDREEQEFENDAGAYLRFWPILNLGVRIGVS